MLRSRGLVWETPRCWLSRCSCFCWAACSYCCNSHIIEVVPLQSYYAISYQISYMRRKYEPRGTFLMKAAVDLLKVCGSLTSLSSRRPCWRTCLKGKAVIHDGVAYWAEGSGKTGIIQHIPFKETMLKSAEEAIKAAQMTAVIAAAASTCIILGALIIQTKYLAAKLDKIQVTVDEIAGLHSQNIVYYMDKVQITLEELRLQNLAKGRILAHEIRRSLSLLAASAAKRNHALSFY